jgi:DNA-directed RNA polymerase specialized sigma24 family protein
MSIESRIQPSSELCFVRSYIDKLPECLDAAEKAGTELGSGATDSDWKTGVMQEFLRHLPEFFVIARLLDELPVLQERFARSYRRDPVLRPCADDIAADAVKKILNNFFGNWPRDNVEAYVAIIEKRVGIDAYRKLMRIGNRVRAVDPQVLANRPGPLDIWSDLLDLTAQEQQIVELRLERLTVEAIADQLKLTCEQVQECLEKIRRLGRSDGSA